MKSRWCPQLSRPIPTLDAILAFGLLSILSCSGMVSCITERWSEQLYNYSSCTIVHNKHYRNNSRVPQRHRKTAAGSVGWSSWSIRKNLHCWQCPGHPQWLVHGPVPCRLVQLLVALCHNLHNCTAGQERERNCSRISRNWRQLRVCKSVPPPVVPRHWAQDVNFCDAKIERLFLNR